MIFKFNEQKMLKRANSTKQIEFVKQTTFRPETFHSTLTFIIHRHQVTLNSLFILFLRGHGPRPEFLQCFDLSQTRKNMG